METLWSGKLQFFVAEKIVNKAFTGLQLAKSAFLIATLFDESQKKVHFNKLKCDIKHVSIQMSIMSDLFTHD